MWLAALVILATSAHAASGQGDLTETDHCTSVKGGKKIFFIKQWHLPPDINSTNIEKSKSQPQYQNQFEIFSAISQMIAEKKIDTAIAEGCEGQIDSNFKPAFNGWTFEKLSKETSEKDYAAIITHPLLKAEAKYPSRLKTLCGDNLAEIKNAQLALSDMRGDVGYWQRIVELEKNPAKLKLYLDGVIEMFKLPKDTNAQGALLSLKKDMFDSFQKFTLANQKRNESLVEAIKKSDSDKPIVVVYGGLHTADLKSKFESEKWNCEIFEPKSYKNSEEKLINDFKKLTK